MSKYTDVYFGYKPGANINQYASAQTELKKSKQELVLFKSCAD